MARFTDKNAPAGLPIQHEGFLRHRNFRWLKIAVALSIAALLAYLIADVEPRPNGGTWIGYTLGAISAILIVWLTLLGVRKRSINPGKWTLKGWTSAHVYLGSSLIVLATLHTGFQLGWNVHTLAYALMMIVVLSGFFGVYYYATVPARMSDNRGQRSQVELLEAIRALDRQLRDAARPLDDQYVREVKRAIRKTKIRPPFFGSLKSVQRSCATDRALKRLVRAAQTADEDQRRAIEDVKAILQRKSALLLRTRQHIRYKMLLRLWLHIHVPMTLALLVALSAHIISVFFYW
ncbi:MAG: hypothetical protein AAFW81_05855 [Pseudomonadota bacterium]